MDNNNSQNYQQGFGLYKQEGNDKNSGLGLNDQEEQKLQQIQNPQNYQQGYGLYNNSNNMDNQLQQGAGLYGGKDLTENENLEQKYLKNENNIKQKFQDPETYQGFRIQDQNNEVNGSGLYVPQRFVEVRGQNAVNKEQQKKK